MNKIFLLIIGFGITFLYGCKGPEEKPHEHADEVTLSHTIWSEQTELFVEFEPLIIGEVTRFAAHFTNLDNFKAITDGKVTVSLIKGKKGIRQTVEGPSSPGIFIPELEPKEKGIFDLVFEIETSDFTDKITIPNIEVYSSHDEALQKVHPEEENPNEITFLKEQAWKIEFANQPAIRDTIYEVIKTGGKILPAQGDEKTIASTTSGIIVYNSTNIIIGSEVKNGQSLFTIAGGDLTNENVENQFLKAKSNYDRAKSNHDRKKELYDLKAISKAEYEEALNGYELAKTEYFNLSKNFSKSGKSIKSSASGYIKNLYKNEGEYVEAGEPLAMITKNKRLTIKADIGQGDYPKLNNQISANFLYNGILYSIEDFNGRLLSYGRSVSNETPKIPVYFELDNTGDLLSGSFIEVWIKTNPIQSGLKIPSSALLEDYGKYSVIVQTGGESFEKREVTTGVSDGRYVHIITGINEGERVVTKGAYQVKMASMAGQVPAHGHSH